ncbi:adenine phosphoribosyltransferase [bacterium]|nr:adenine phosphoribosyltransferase [bacterium]
MDYKKIIRSVPDFPKPGINFKDITTLVGNADALKTSCTDMSEKFRDRKIDAVAGIESRGFIFGSMIAVELGVGFIPVRKPGKLPAKTISASYELEYGQNVLHMHTDAVAKGQRILIVDDLLATGGTLRATCDLVEQLGGIVCGIAVVAELTFLSGRDKLKSYDLVSLVTYDEE